MLGQDVLQKIKHIEILTTRLLSGSMVGDSRSAIKGSGLEFDQIRDYYAGDDVRYIDWNSSARMNKLLIKQYIEERNRTVFLAVDVSLSTYFSSDQQSRHDFIATIASVLALVADYGKDHVGLLLFSDTVEKVIPIKRGKNHVRSIMQALFSFKPQQSKTDITVALNYIAGLKRKDAIVILLSDFIADSFEKNLSIVSSRHDIIAIRCLDTLEFALPNVGFLTIKDNETGSELLLNTHAHNQGSLERTLQTHRNLQEKIFARYGIHCITLTSGKPYVGELIRFFRRRMRY